MINDIRLEEKKIFNEIGLQVNSNFTKLFDLEYIINSFKRPHDDRKLSNALSENMNSQIRAHLAISRGVANFSRFRKRMLFSFNSHVFYSSTKHLKSDKRKGKPRGKYKK